MNNEELEKQKREIYEAIEKLGYESLRYSVFLPEGEHRQEWQWRLDYEDGKYLLYGLADRASILGRKFEFKDFSEAKAEFLDRLHYMVKVNKRKVDNKEAPYYLSPLWDPEISEN